jgi:hypothetical protein
VRRRRKLAKRLTTADVRGARKKKPVRGGILRRTKNVYPRPKKIRPKPERPARTPRMRPKKTVGEMLRPDEGTEARPNVRLRIVGVVGVALFALLLLRLWYLLTIPPLAGHLE